MKYTKTQLMEHSPCKDGLAFAQSCDFDFVKIWKTCPDGAWLIWLLRKAGVMDKPMAVRIAISCAEHALPLFEKRYPKDERPRKALEAAAAWLKEPTEENRKKARAAAAADAAAYTAADAAAYAAADAYAADAYARKKERLWQAEKIRELVPCPFEN